ncbi:hypothetical protein D0C16_07350 [Cellvibrio sp. KY-GH-1]|uniref:hypothetical protein n=1 Tax=Cellvibrio sp. KY-GH-1 TaxID=2303332 RepID=UPI0012439CAE|nr:hypothetical protein [Cellvibrio sp. KY-GH-1]QEY15805.1 hypothetical protein D0C16_07350 [Cellvibrio sp. KY-GH-1]
MSRYHFSGLITFIICSALLACSTKVNNPNEELQSTQFQDLLTPVITYDWNTPLPSPEGKILITYQLPQYARAEFYFFNQKITRRGAALAAVKLSNENCLTGHQTSVGYSINNGEFYTKYFTTELNWGSQNTISIHLKNDKTIQVTTNNETLSVPITTSSRRLQIVSYYAPIEIKHVQYFSE